MNIDSIEENRERIAEIDAEIVKLISKRTEIANNIGLLKTELGLPTRDRSTEDKVLKRYRDLADLYGLPEDLIESVAVMLIDTAIDRQERQRKRGII